MSDAAPRTDAPRFSMADQVVLNFLACLVLTRWPAAHGDLWIEEMSRAIPSTSKQNPKMWPIVEAAAALIRAYPAREGAGQLEFWEARLRAERALEAFFWWRGAQAHAVLFPQPAAPELDLEQGDAA